jgi:radical SAM superfamily enzyme YgiQ (UPF0313 family)
LQPEAAAAIGVPPDCRISSAEEDGRMRILSIIPPHVPSYFNAGHHLMTFELGAYLRKAVADAEVVCVDCAALNFHWRRLCTLLHEGFDLIVVMVDHDGIDPLARFIRYARALSPRARIVVYGRLTYQVPGFFERYDLDAIVESGDPEAAVAAYARWLRDDTVEPGGIRRREGKGFRSSLPGRWMPADEWVLPDVSEIPYEAYDRMYQQDLDKFCGIPQRRELVVPVARGCPVGCVFCDVPQREGKLGRWLPVERILAYIDDAFRAHPFEYVSFYAPTFTLQRDWVEALCAALRSRSLSWKCTTTLFHLDAALIRTMAEAGCVRISVGLETLGHASPSVMPRIKRDVGAKFELVADACNEAGVELNCFVILGLPGDSAEDVAHTIARVQEKGARVRPTIYTPYQELTAEMDEETVASYNRQLFVEGVVDAGMAPAFYELCYANENDRPTEVFDRIPAAGRARAEAVGALQ